MRSTFKTYPTLSKNWGLSMYSIIVLLQICMSQFIIYKQALCGTVIKINQNNK